MYLLFCTRWNTLVVRSCSTQPCAMSSKRLLWTTVTNWQEWKKVLKACVSFWLPWASMQSLMGKERSWSMFLLQGKFLAREVCRVLIHPMLIDLYYTNMFSVLVICFFFFFTGKPSQWTHWHWIVYRIWWKVQGMQAFYTTACSVCNFIIDCSKMIQ